VDGDGDSVRALHVWSSLTCPLLPDPLKFTSESTTSCSSCVTSGGDQSVDGACGKSAGEDLERDGHDVAL
jgi:hypothetical protein